MSRGVHVIMVFVALLVCTRSGVARGHAFRPLVLEVRQVDAHSFRVAWTRGPLAEAVLDPGDLRVSWPDGCVEREEVVRCASGLVGTVEVEGLTRAPVELILNVKRDGEPPETVVLTSEQPLAKIGREVRAVPRTVGAYLRLGVEHILAGWDHLLFVLGLLLLVVGARPLLLTITAFTLAHSVTLAAAVLGQGALPTAPVEVAIALSIVFLALEILRPQATALGRKPWRAAAAFGLLHGLGFAGALRGLHLGGDGLWPALLGFNLGVELGQLAVVGAALALWALVPRTVHPVARRVLAYVMGILATAWVFERMLALGEVSP